MKIIPHTELRRGSRRQPQVTRSAILQAALVEFAREGLAGARMDAIADAAGVNKALLYYYFRDKETLYGAILDTFFEPLVRRIIAVCERPGSAGERFLAYARAHFDAIAESQYYAHIFMGELMSASRGDSPLLEHIFERYMRPIGALVLTLVQEGVKSGEFRHVDPNQFVPSVIGCIVHYFLTAPVRQKFMPGVDFNSAEAIQQRRAAVLDFIAAALFTDRDNGTRLAADIATAPTEARTECRAPSRKAREREKAMPAPKPPVPTPPAGPVVDALPNLGSRYNDRWLPDFKTGYARVQAEKKQRAERASRRKAKLRQAEGTLRQPMPPEGGDA